METSLVKTKCRFKTKVGSFSLKKAASLRQSQGKVRALKFQTEKRWPDKHRPHQSFRICQPLIRRIKRNSFLGRIEMFLRLDNTKNQKIPTLERATVTPSLAKVRQATRNRIRIQSKDSTL